MKIDSDLLKVLMEMGFLATNTRRLREAVLIFKGVALARPKSAYPKIGTACVAMLYSDFSRAVEILRAAPASDRHQHELRNGYLGLALKLGGYQDESHRILTHLHREGKFDLAVRMADALL